MMYSNYHTCSVDNRELLKCCYFLNIQVQGFQSGTVPGTFTRLRSCIVPAEITEPPKLAVVKTTSTWSTGLWNIFHKKINDHVNC